MNLREFHDQIWWPNCQAKLRECTLQGYASAWKCHINSQLGDYELKDITVQVLESWLNDFKTAGAARKSWAVLRAIIRTAERYDYIDKDPTRKVKNVPGKPHYEPTTLDKNEIMSIIEGFRDTPLEAWLLCSTTLGLRKEEVCALYWSDINLETGEVKIDKGVQWVNGREVFNPPKTRLSYRTVYLPDFALERLKELYTPSLADARISGNLNVNQITSHYRNICAQKKLPYVPPKNLRHSWATIALSEGVPLSIISRNLGHYDVSTTARYYLAPKKEDLRQASETYNDALLNTRRNRWQKFKARAKHWWANLH